MPSNSEAGSTTVLLIDESKNQRTHWTNQLQRSSPNYLIIEAEDRESGLALYRSRRVDCVVLDLALSDPSGFQLLAELVQIASRPQVAVVVLTQMAQRAVWEIAKTNGAYECLAKQFTSGEDLD